MAGFVSECDLSILVKNNREMRCVGMVLAVAVPVKRCYTPWPKVA